MKSGKKLTLGLVPTLLALLSLLMASCGSTSSGPVAGQAPKKAPDAQQIYRIGEPVADVKTLDPAQAVDLASAQAQEMIFTGLVMENDQLQPTGQLATSWDVSPDGLTYTFHLRTGMKFSDGTPLNANDVAYSIDRALSPTLYNATYAVNDVAWCSLYQAGIVQMIKKYVQGVVINAQDVTPPDDWASVYISVH